MDDGVVFEVGGKVEFVGDGADGLEDFVGSVPLWPELAFGGGGGGGVDVVAGDPGERVEGEGEVAAGFVGLGGLGFLGVGEGSFGLVEQVGHVRDEVGGFWRPLAGRVGSESGGGVGVEAVGEEEGGGLGGGLDGVVVGEFHGGEL